jgi:3-deoxy-D-manno-octulosonic-acid transferase
VGGEGQPALLLDTFGELAKVYAVADVAFVGGSLVRQGGQSVFQPLAQGVPAVFGPYMSNQRDIAALSKAEGVGFEVKDPNELAAEVIRLLSLPPDEKRRLAEKARALIERNQGVSAQCVEEVARLLPTTAGKS